MERHDLAGTAGKGVATQVRVPVTLDKVNIEILQEDYVRIVCIVIVPGDWIAVFMRMNEGDGRREVVVALHDVREVCICFPSLVSKGAIVLLVSGSKVDMLCGVSVSMPQMADCQSCSSSCTQLVSSVGAFAITMMRSGSIALGIATAVP